MWLSVENLITNNKTVCDIMMPPVIRKYVKLKNNGGGKKLSILRVTVDEILLLPVSFWVSDIFD